MSSVNPEQSVKPKAGSQFSLQRRETPEDIPQVDGYSELLCRLLAARGVSSADELSMTLKSLQPVSSLKDIDKAVKRLRKALNEQQRILIVGDFDADGATATTLSLRALRSFGFQSVDYLVPNRFEYGYGLTPEIIALALPDKPDLIITVDNGISSIDGVEFAAAHGIDVLITDHHLPGRQLPDAVAIVNPNQPGDEFASKNLAGVGVVFYLMLALKQALHQEGYFTAYGLEQPNLVQWLDLVALGTVADVVPLDANNRILVEQGLRRIRSGKCCAGITAMMRLAKKPLSSASSQDLGFVCGPRLNAAGRLDDMSLGIECLLTDSSAQAYELAAELDGMNRDRRSMEAGMKHEALQQLDRLSIDADNLPAIICLFSKEWHQGIVGIIAARIRELYYRPCLIFAPGTEGELKGSGRSIPGIHMRDVLDRVATQNPGLVEKFGGHAMAAGLSLKSTDFRAFQQAVIAVVEDIAPQGVYRETVLSDGELSDQELSLPLAEELGNAVPWGQAFPAPVFDGEFEIVQRKVLKNAHLKLVLRPASQRRTVQAIAFNVNPEAWPQIGEPLRAVYQLSVNEFNYQRSLQLLLQRRIL